MGTARTYQDSCGTAHGLDLVGERWGLLVVRELVLGPQRFSDLLAALPGISTNVLTARLGELEAAGVVRRRRLPPPAASAVYELTAWGSELEPVICALGRWAARSPTHDKTQNFSISSMVLSFRTNFSPEAAGDFAAVVEFRVGNEVVTARIADGVLAVGRGAADRPDAVVTGSPKGVAAIVYGGLPVADAGVSLTGDPAVFARYVRCFVLPPTATLDACP